MVGCSVVACRPVRAPASCPRSVKAGTESAAAHEDAKFPSRVLPGILIPAGAADSPSGEGRPKRRDGAPISQATSRVAPSPPSYADCAGGQGAAGDRSSGRSSFDPTPVRRIAGACILGLLQAVLGFPTRRLERASFSRAPPLLEGSTDLKMSGSQPEDCGSLSWETDGRQPLDHFPGWMRNAAVQIVDVGGDRSGLPIVLHFVLANRRSSAACFWRTIVDSFMAGISLAAR